MQPGFPNDSVVWRPLMPSSQYKNNNNFNIIWIFQYRVSQIGIWRDRSMWPCSLLTEKAIGAIFIWRALNSRDLYCLQIDSDGGEWLLRGTNTFDNYDEIIVDQYDCKGSFYWQRWIDARVWINNLVDCFCDCNYIRSNPDVDLAKPPLKLWHGL